MKKVFLLGLFVSLFSAAFALENLKVGNTTRTMIVYAPSGLPSQPALVIACHGYNQDAPYLQSQAKFENVADTAKFVVVYANGVNKAWDISGNSDLQYLEAIINEMYSRYHINKNRVYLTGFSMGGMFTYHAANRMSDKIAAFAPVSGYPMGGPNPAASRPVPILHTHGTGDDVCTYSPVQSHIDAWVKFNGCNTTPEVTAPQSAANPSTTTSTLKRYKGGKNGVEVALLTLPGKGHWWSMDPPFGLTSVEVWNFCKRYTLGAEEPEVKNIVPENQSFDLLPARDNTFVVTFSDLVDPAQISATLQPTTGEGIALKVKTDTPSKDITFALPASTPVPDGTYTLNIVNAVTMSGGVLPHACFTYVYGVEEVSDTPNYTTFLQPDWVAERATNEQGQPYGEGIPAGWRRYIKKSDGTSELLKGKVDDCSGVRLKYFPAGGDFDAGFYLSAREHSSCTLTYGLYDGNRLMLQPGNYRLTFNSIYWSEGAMQGNATYNMKITNGANKTIFSAPSLTSSSTMKESTAKPIAGSKAYTFDFTIPTAANYMLHFDMASGWNSVIIGNIRLTTQPTLADLYKGTFRRTLLAAQRALDGHDESSVLRSTVEEYADLVSTSPSVYTAATRELTDALQSFQTTGIRSFSHTPNPSSHGIFYSLAGTPFGTDAASLPRGLYIYNGKKFIVN